MKTDPSPPHLSMVRFHHPLPLFYRNGPNFFRRKSTSTCSRPICSCSSDLASSTAFSFSSSCFPANSASVFSFSSFFQAEICVGWTPNLQASSAILSRSFIASRATRALNSGVNRLRFFGIGVLLLASPATGTGLHFSHWSAERGPL